MEHCKFPSVFGGAKKSDETEKSLNAKNVIGRKSGVT